MTGLFFAAWTLSFFCVSMPLLINRLTTIFPWESNASYGSIVSPMIEEAAAPPLCPFFCFLFSCFLRFLLALCRFSLTNRFWFRLAINFSRSCLVIALYGCLSKLPSPSCFFVAVATCSETVLDAKVHGICSSNVWATVNSVSSIGSHWMSSSAVRSRTLLADLS